MEHPKEYQWHATRAFGDRAATEVAEALQRAGQQVVDISQLKDAQRRGIDLLVDGDYCDVKSDRYPPNNFFFESDCDGQPGCFWKSRADYWLYWFPGERKLYRINLPEAQRWIAVNHPQDYPNKTIRSRSGDRTWQAVGVLVPVDELVDAGIAVDLSHLMNEDVA